MKLSNLNAKLTCIKNKAVKVLAAATLAGTIFTVAAPAAQAQRIVVGIGGPRYFVPPPPVRFYGPYDYYGYGWHRHEDWRYRHVPYGYGRRY